MPATDRTDARIARIQADLEERNSFIQGLIAGAEEGDKPRDLTDAEKSLIGEHRSSITTLMDELQLLEGAADIAAQSRDRAFKLNERMQAARGAPGAPGEVEYRSAGEYIADVWLARAQGDRDAYQRIEVFHRAAAHQTTDDNPGLLPQRIVEPVLSFVDQSRPLVTALGPRDLGPGSWAYARVTQHTQVGQQAAEKTELASRQMVIDLTPITAPTFGGYVNVSKQNIRRTSPGILNMVLDDLAGEYAIETEKAACDAFTGAAQAGPAIGGDTAFDVAKAVWGAVAMSWAGTRGKGRPILAASPDMMAYVGPLFPNVNPQNGYSTGFDASQFGQGPQGNIVGLVLAMSQGFADGTLLALNSAAVRCFEDRYGSMQVNEPSVWGVQVGYAGDFEPAIYEAAGIVSIGAPTP